MRIALTTYADDHDLALLDALLHAADAGFELNSYANPIDDGATDLGVEEAAEVATIDPSLVYLTRD